jgi:hypothetical protein
MSKDNLPAKRSPEDILNAEPDTLTTAEKAFRDAYTADLVRQTEVVDKALPPMIEIAHGMELFKLPNGDTTAELEGTIIDFVPVRAMYSKPANDDDEGELLCSSVGNIFGNPTAAGESFDESLSTSQPMCDGCPYDKWSDKGGKACKEKGKTIFRPEGDGEKPAFLMVPTTSLKNWFRFLKLLSGKKTPISACSLKLRLSHKSSGSRQWSVIEFPQDVEKLTVPEFNEVVKSRSYWETAMKVDLDAEAAAATQAGETVDDDEDTDPLPF